MAAKNSTRTSPALTGPGIVTVWFIRLPTVLAAPTNAIVLVLWLMLCEYWSVAPSLSVTVRVTVRGPGPG